MANEYSQLITLDNLNQVYQDIKEDMNNLSQIFDVKGDIFWKSLREGIAVDLPENWDDMTAEQKTSFKQEHAKDGLIKKAEVYTIKDTIKTSTGEIKQIEIVNGTTKEDGFPESLHVGDNVLCLWNFPSVGYKLDFTKNDKGKKYYNPEDPKDPDNGKPLDDSWLSWWQEVGSVIPTAKRDRMGAVSIKEQEFAGKKKFFKGEDNSAAAIEVVDDVNGDVTVTTITPNEIIIGEKKTLTTNKLQMPVPEKTSKTKGAKALAATPEVVGTLKINETATASPNSELGILTVTDSAEVKTLSANNCTLKIPEGTIGAGKEGNKNTHCALGVLNVTTNTNVGTLTGDSLTVTGKSTAASTDKTNVNLGLLNVKKTTIVDGVVQEVKPDADQPGIYNTEIKNTFTTDKLAVTGTANIATESNLGKVQVSGTVGKDEYNTTCTTLDAGVGKVRLSSGELIVASASDLGVIQASETYVESINKGNAKGNIDIAKDGTLNVASTSSLGVTTVTSTTKVNSLGGDGTVHKLELKVKNDVSDATVTIAPTSNLGTVTASETNIYAINPQDSTKQLNLTIEGSGNVTAANGSSLGKVTLSKDATEATTFKSISASQSNLSISGGDTGAAIEVKSGSFMGNLTVTEDTSITSLTGAKTLRATGADGKGGEISVKSGSLGKLEVIGEATTSITTLDADTIKVTSVLDKDGVSLVPGTGEMAVDNINIHKAGDSAIYSTLQIGTFQTDPDDISTKITGIEVKGAKKNGQYGPGYLSATTLLSDSIITDSVDTASVSSESVTATTVTATGTVSADILSSDSIDTASISTSSITTDNITIINGNDIADAIEISIKPEFGYCYYFDGQYYNKTNKYCQKGIMGVHSDTYGLITGQKKREYELNIAVSGFVLAYVDKEYPAGTPLTCTAEGKLTKMGPFARMMHPERCVGTYWKPENNDKWNNIAVNGRHWVKVK